MKITQLREIIREEIKSINEGKLDRIGSHLIKDLDKKFKGKKGTTSTFNKIKKELKRKMPGVSDMVAGSIANQYNDFLLDKDLDDKEKIRLMAGTLKRLGMKESVNESVKRQYRDVYSKYYKTYKAFATGVMDLAKSVSKISGDKTDERIILKNFTKQIIPFASLMRSWSKGHEKNPHIDEKIKVKIQNQTKSISEDIVRGNEVHAKTKKELKAAITRSMKEILNGKTPKYDIINGMSGEMIGWKDGNDYIWQPNAIPYAERELK